MGTGLLDLLPKVSDLLSKVLKLIYINYNSFSFSSPFASGDPGGKVRCCSCEFD